MADEASRRMPAGEGLPAAFPADSERQHNLDLLRILACFMIVMLHTSASDWSAVDVNSLAWKVFNLYDSAVRSAIPLFFLLSGKLFLEKERLSLPVLFKKNIAKLLVVYVFWSFLYALDTIGPAALLSQGSAAQLLGTVIDAKYHLWFLPAMIGAYLLMPALHAIVRHESGKYLPYCCLMFFLFCVIKETILLYPFGDSYLPDILDRFDYELIGFSGYLLLGRFLSGKDLSRLRSRYLVLSLALIIGASVKIGELHAIAQGVPSGILYGDKVLPVYLEAALLFLLFLKLRVTFPRGAARLIAAVSRCTLFIYLLHPFVLEHLRSWFGLTTLSFAPWLSVPAITAFIFICCAVIALPLLKIPVVNKWLI